MEVGETKKQRNKETKKKEYEEEWRGAKMKDGETKKQRK